MRSGTTEKMGLCTMQRAMGSPRLRQGRGEEGQRCLVREGVPVKRPLCRFIRYNSNQPGPEAKGLQEEQAASRGLELGSSLIFSRS